MTEQNDEVARLTALLAAAVKFSNTTQREVERKLDLSSGSLSRLFSGGIELKLKHVLEICEAIGLPPSCFFEAALPPRQEQKSADASRLQRLLQQLHPAIVSEIREEQASPAASPTHADIERMVIAAMSKYFSNLGSSAPANGVPR